MSFTFDPLPHAEAVKRIADLPLVSREMFDELLPELKAYAFTITGLDGFDQMSRARDLIKAVPAGEKTWAQAKKEIADELSSALGGTEARARAELLLRTHTFRGYAVSRYRLLMQQRDVFPFWQYKTHGDDRVRPSHVELSGKIFPAGHPIWQRIFPPWDWGCRCLVVPMMKDEVGRMKDEEQAMAPDARRVYDGDLADAIHTGERLPNGVSLLPSSSWSASPWSEPGNVRHTWQLVQERYANEPEVLSAFAKWSQQTKIPDLGITVDEWLGGAVAKAPRAAAKAAAPTAGASASSAMGTSLIGKLDATALSKKETARVADVLGAISSVHGDGPLPVIPVGHKAGGHLGAFTRMHDRTMRIDYRKTARPGGELHPHMTLAHEIGHFLDHAGMQKTSMTSAAFATNEVAHTLDPKGILADWWKAVLKSEAWKELRTAPNLRGRNYYLKTIEAWARSYAQFIAEESGNEIMLAELATIRASKTGMRQWATEDFEPIRAAIRSLFEGLGWMKPKAPTP